jgi:hypothetical protein
MVFWILLIKWRLYFDFFLEKIYCNSKKLQSPSLPKHPKNIHKITPFGKIPQKQNTFSEKFHSSFEPRKNNKISSKTYFQFPIFRKKY